MLQLTLAFFTLLLCSGLVSAQVVVTPPGGGGSSITQGGGSCAVDASGNITCEVPSGGTFTVTDGTTNWIAVDANGAIDLTPTSGQRLKVTGGSIDSIGSDWLIYRTGTLSARIGPDLGAFRTAIGIGATPSTPDIYLLRSAANIVKLAGDASGTAVADLWVNRAIGIGAVTPTMGLLHIDKGTGFGQITIDGSSGGCIMFRDTDDAGWTEVTFLDGTITSTTDADGVCDGS